MRRRRWLWIVLVLVLVIGAFAARYVSIGPGGHHRFDIGGSAQDLPLMSPTILGWIGPTRPARIDSAQFSPDGEWMYLRSLRGERDQLASVTLSSPSAGVLLVDLRLIEVPSAGGTAVGILFGTRVPMAHYWYDGHPPLVIDASRDEPVVVDTYVP